MKHKCDACGADYDGLLSGDESIALVCYDCQIKFEELARDSEKVQEAIKRHGIAVRDVMEAVSEVYSDWAKSNGNVVFKELGPAYDDCWGGGPWAGQGIFRRPNVLERVAQASE